jgi:hypothetical protein
VAVPLRAKIADVQRHFFRRQNGDAQIHCKDESDKFSHVVKQVCGAFPAESNPAWLAAIANSG